LSTKKYVPIKIIQTRRYFITYMLKSLLNAYIERLWLYHILVALAKLEHSWVSTKVSPSTYRHSIA
jgi:hypothetical protein